MALSTKGINWYPYAERKWTTNLYLSLSTKAISRWIKDLAVKANTKKLLEENRREKREGLRQPFLSNQETSLRETSKLHFIKIKKTKFFPSWKMRLRERKCMLHTRRKYSWIIDKRLSFLIHKHFSKFINNQTISEGWRLGFCPSWGPEFSL